MEIMFAIIYTVLFVVLAIGYAKSRVDNHKLRDLLQETWDLSSEIPRDLWERIGEAIGENELWFTPEGEAEIKAIKNGQRSSANSSTGR